MIEEINFCDGRSQLSLLRWNIEVFVSTMTNPRKYRDKIKIQEEKMKMQQLEFERTMREVSPIVFPRVSVISMSNGLITLVFYIDSGVSVYEASLRRWMMNFCVVDWSRVDYNVTLFLQLFVRM